LTWWERVNHERIGKEIIERKKKVIRAYGGCLGYPEAKKDVISCEKPWGGANNR
jgi:hypothetical protein